MLFGESIGRDRVVYNGNLYIVDTCDTPDCGYETAIYRYSLGSIMQALEYWNEYGDEEEPLTLEQFTMDNPEYADFVEETIDTWEWGSWDVVKRYKTAENATKGHAKYVENPER